MMISTKSRYALRFLADLAEHQADGFVPLRDVAARQEISEKYLEIVVKELVKGGLLDTLRGKGGGYRLKNPPGEYGVIDIIRLTDGPLAPVACLEPGREDCPRRSECRTLPLWQGLDKVIRGYLEQFTLADLAKDPKPPAAPHRPPLCEAPGTSGVEIQFDQMENAISVMREVAAWGREQGFRVWPDTWLTPEELLGPDVQPENFCVGLAAGEISCAFILQWTDSEYWPDTPKFEAAYLHKLCVRRSHAGKGMTKAVVDAVREECRKRGIPYIRLDTALDERQIRKIYLDAGFRIVHIVDHPNGRSTALYELEL